MTFGQVDMFENRFVTLDVFPQRAHAHQPFGFPDPDHFQKSGLPDDLLLFLIDEIEPVLADHRTVGVGFGEDPLDLEGGQALKRFHDLIEIGVDVLGFLAADGQKIEEYFLYLVAVRGGEVQQRHEGFQFRRQGETGTKEDDADVAGTVLAQSVVELLNILRIFLQLQPAFHLVEQGLDLVENKNAWF